MIYKGINKIKISFIKQNIKNKKYITIDLLFRAEKVLIILDIKKLQLYLILFKMVHYH